MNADIARRRLIYLAWMPAMVLILGGLAGIANAQQADVALMHRVDRALRSDNRLNGAAAYTASPGVIVLYGKVFDEKDRQLAQETAAKVPGVKQVVNTLLTMTGQWLEEESRINDTLQLNGLEGVSARVIGPEAYLSGQVTSQADKQRAVSVVASVSNLQVVNFIRVVPGQMFSTPNFL